jgi:hypothetical protein
VAKIRRVTGEHDQLRASRYTDGAISGPLLLASCRNYALFSSCWSAAYSLHLRGERLS